ncbi:ribbon-helix-helix protein, CopG family [Hyphomicrobium sp.]|uniref:ribbon-helix-helix protein, CopG family n=1 Tax=Hyphomicrobium sp. TaxID=82 RepID=UPI0025BF89E3|nr:ribbon-helix-helix protein, CopG family [Hyphomicrobium sp.]MCC7253824.1 ribbon-helix-helix protein, CopG family [Hyphomicrobium sp.]
MLQPPARRGRPRLYARRITLRLTEQQDAGLRALAAETGQDVESLIRTAIERELRRRARAARRG